MSKTITEQVEDKDIERKNDLPRCYTWRRIIHLGIMAACDEARRKNEK